MTTNSTPLDGRVALVTGASSGIGAAIAVALLEAGARVHAAARRRESIAALVVPQMIASGRFVPHALDVSDAAAVDELGRQLAAQDPIDILVCAAGMNVTERRFSQLTEESFEQVLRTNLFGAFSTIRTVLPQLRERQGDVVMISSVAASWPDHSGPAYGASKSGMLGLARGLGLDEHANGVRVSTILPGIVNTPILAKRPIPPTPQLRAWCIQPEDVAAATVFAVSLPKRANAAEITLVATRLQSLGRTQQANPELPAQLAAAAGSDGAA